MKGSGELKQRMKGIGDPNPRMVKSNPNKIVRNLTRKADNYTEGKLSKKDHGGPTGKDVTLRLVK